MIKSRYKILGGFGLLVLLNIIIVFGLIKLLTKSKISFYKVNILYNSDALFVYSIFSSLLLLLIWIFVTHCKAITIDDFGIKLSNPLFPVLQKQYSWDDFDYYILVDEESKYNVHESIWLLKDQKIKARFSSFYYSNYPELKSNIKTKSKGKKEFHLIDQFLSIIGLMKVDI
jgi:hypothetical protein